MVGGWAILNMESATSSKYNNYRHSNISDKSIMPLRKSKIITFHVTMSALTSINIYLKVKHKSAKVAHLPLRLIM